MNLADLAIKNKTTTLVLTVCTAVGGVLAYQSLGRLEDPEFTIKDAVISTPYPGASPEEVEQEVTDRLELALQQLGQLKEIRQSISERGMSTVKPRIKDKYDKSSLPQVWDELRRKVGDIQSQLPPGAGPTIVNDDFGDVFGVFFALTGEEYSYRELEDVSDVLRKELVLVQDVAKVQPFGIQREAVYVELNRDRISQLGIPPSAIIAELRQKNLVVDAGRIQVDPEFLPVEPSGQFGSIEDFEGLLIRGASGDEQIYLRDVADVRRGYVDPPRKLLRYDGKPAVGLGVSTVSDGNVVTMGEALRDRMVELQDRIPLGIDFGIISLQSEAVIAAIDSFISSLLQAIAIVIAVLLIFMGLRSGLLIGFILFLTIAGTFIVMAINGITLERISLGALIIALGMLVDNAIVVVDGMLVRMEQGVEPEQAASSVVKQSAWPLLGATFVAILAFAAIGTSQDSTGEYTRSLFYVILYSLLLSWVFAVTVTPLLGAMFLKVKRKKTAGQEQYGGKFYGRYRHLLSTCIRYRLQTVALVVVMFMLAMMGFRFVPAGFFPASTRPQFIVDFYMPQGTHVEETLANVEQIERYIMAQEGVTHVTSVVGGSSLRFLLTFAPEKDNSAYALMLVDVDDFGVVDRLTTDVQRYLNVNYPSAVSDVKKFLLGPNEGGRIQARFVGQDPDTLRQLAAQAVRVLEADGAAKGVRIDWAERVKKIQPIVAEEQANLNGITRDDIARAIRQGFEGETVGMYREEDKLLPIIARAPEVERTDVASIQNLQIWSPAAGRMIPLRQVVSGFETVWEDEVIMRKDRKRTMIVHANQVSGPASDLFERVRPDIEAIEFPPGYHLEWGGEYEDSNRARAGLIRMLPVFILLMVLIVIMLFNNLRQPLIIWLVVPLSLIGVTIGLVTTQNPFDFMAVLGFMSLMGMLIKNAIVLIDEINAQLAEGKATYDAIMNSGVSRLRPVAMAALTTALGMIPLLRDPFFIAMAVTIIFGLLFATGLTMIVVPTLYALFYRVRAPAS
ncbi:MAG: efflux RND transporter permease subunit [Gemmatimonadota bacterium]|nr:MAG: efflux RND transporter permease subunit [Gemmatimonadota bacterium]